MKTINTKSLGRPRGYSNGQLTREGARLLFIAGQIGWDEEQRLVSDDFVEQFDRALRNVLAVVLEAGGAPGRGARLLLYATGKAGGPPRPSQGGGGWGAGTGGHYPPRAFLGVQKLLPER